MLLLLQSRVTVPSERLEKKYVINIEMIRNFVRERIFQVMLFTKSNNGGNKLTYLATDI